MTQPVLTIAIETSNPPATPGGGRIALARVGGGAFELAAQESIGASARHDDALMPAIERLCAGAGVRPGALRRVAVSAGPGGYTSVRIAVTSAKMICMATGAELRLVPTALGVYLGIDDSTRFSTPLRVLLAWKREDAWCVEYEADADLHSEAQRGGRAGRLVSINDAARDISRPIVADAALCAAIKSTHPDTPLITAAFDAASIARASEFVEPTDPLIASPIYPREPEAVSKWRQLGRGG